MEVAGQGGSIHRRITTAVEQIESKCPSMHGEQRGTPPLHHEQTERRSLDEEEEKKRTEFINTGCGCTLNKWSYCSSIFSKNHYATIPGYKRSDIQILTSSTTKKGIWLLYEETARQHLRRSVAYFTFCQVWRRFLQHVIVARPMTDLCAVCQKNSAAIIRSVNLSEEEKSEVHYT